MNRNRWGMSFETYERELNEARAKREKALKAKSAEVAPFVAELTHAADAIAIAIVNFRNEPNEVTREIVIRAQSRWLRARLATDDLAREAEELARQTRNEMRRKQDELLAQLVGVLVTVHGYTAESIRARILAENKGVRS